MKSDEENILPLYSCIKETLSWATHLNCKSVSIPAISSGIYGFPKDLCAEILFNAVEDFVQAYNPENTPLRDVRFTNFDTLTTSIFEAEF